jgi:hypothetical protein
VTSVIKRRSSGQRPPARAAGNIFHGIAVEPGDKACEAVRRIAGQRYLSEDAPRVPLDECQCVQDCRCVYRHFPDRRTDVRRDMDMGLPHRPVPGDKRAGVGRRITDG